MKTITIGRQDCDILIPDNNISRKHATISLVEGQYVYQDLSKNGTTIAGKTYYNEKVVVAPGTPIFLANKVQLPWTQVLMLLPNAPVKVQNPRPGVVEEVQIPVQPVEDNSVGVFAGIMSFLFPIVGIILYFVWHDATPAKAKKVLNIALISFAISFVFGFIAGLAA